MNKIVVIKPNQKETICIHNNGEESFHHISVHEFLEKRCLTFGSSMKGREQAFRHITHTKQKSCVLVSEITHECWIPTMSENHPSCMWVSFYDVVKCTDTNDGMCEVLFLSGQKVIVNCTARTLLKQLKRCKQFFHALDENQIEDSHFCGTIK